MIASLYQSGSSSAAGCAGDTASMGTVRFGTSIATGSYLYSFATKTRKHGTYILCVLSRFRGGSEDIRRVRLPARPDLEDVALADFRIEPHVIPFAAPLVHRIVEQVVDGEGGIGRHARNRDVAVLHVVWIEVDNREQPLGSVRRGL